MMQAAVLTTLGSIDNLQIASLPIPKPKSDEALIEVAYCGLNHLDLLIIQGKRKGPDSFPHILGCEVVGTVKEINNSRDFKAGDTVVVYPWTFCGKCPQCLSGHENICDDGGTIGRTQWGGFAKFLSVPVGNLLKIPKDLSSETMCAATLSTITAYHMIERAHIKNRSSVLITGATGGVGTAAIQMLKAKHCQVYATTSHQSKNKLLKKLGIDQVFSLQDFTTQLLNLCPQGVDYAIDIMGGNIWSKAVNTLAKNGTLVFCATTLDGPGQINIATSFARQLNILGSYGATMKDLQEVIKLLQKKVLIPTIDSIYPLKDTKTACEKMDQQRAFGKILIKP